MSTPPSLHNHAIDRLKERFGVDESWLLHELENGRFVWLKGYGNSVNTNKVRSGHLLYIPNRNDYCIVIMDNRSRLAITVLTEDMALKSSWAKGVDEAAKLRAKRIALGEEEVNDCNFIRLYAEERGKLSINVQIRTVLYNWDPIVLNLYKTNIVADQVNPKGNYCTLTECQMNDVSIAINRKLTDKKIRPYCELFVSTGSRKRTALVSNKLDGLSSLENAEQARRWGLS
jgi:hypothetical protein